MDSAAVDGGYYDSLGRWRTPVDDYTEHEINGHFGKSRHNLPLSQWPGRLWGRDHPDWLMKVEVLIRLGSVILVFAANYAHLAYTLNKPKRAFRLQILKLLLVIMMPTFVLSECLFSIGNTIAEFFTTDSMHLRGPETAAEWMKYFCGITGMYVVQDPEIETTTPVEVEAEEGVPATATSAHKAQTAPPMLAQIKFYSDLRHHQLPWNATAVLRIILVLAASLVPVIFASIIIDEFTGLNDFFDVRYIITIVGNGVATLAALIAIVCRSQWSLNHLTISAPSVHRPFFSFACRFILAAILFEMFYLVLENIRGRYNFCGTFFYFFYILGWFNFFWPVLAFAAWVWRAEIAERVKINWWLVGATVLSLCCVWIGLDLVFFFVNDILSIIYYSA